MAHLFDLCWISVRFILHLYWIYVGSQWDLCWFSNGSVSDLRWIPKGSSGVGSGCGAYHEVPEVLLEVHESPKEAPRRSQEASGAQRGHPGRQARRLTQKASNFQ